MDFAKIGKFIKELREEFKMSQNDLAKKLYVEKSNVSRWESGKSSISANNLLEVSKIFQISLDELVAGHRFSNKKENEIVEAKQQVLMNVIDNRNSIYINTKKMSKLLVIAIVIFLIYFFYTFYNSVSDYSVHFENNESNIEYGSLTKMRDRIYFYIELDNDRQDVKKVTLYYISNGERKEIVKQNSMSSIKIVDYYGYEEYFDFKDFDKIIKNMFIEFEMNNGDVENYKLSFNKTYANVNFFLKKEKGNSKLMVDNSDDNNAIEISKNVKIVMDKLREHVGVINVVVDGVDYEVFAIQDGINVSFMENNFKCVYYYNITNEAIFVYKRLVNNKWEDVYSANVTISKCEGNKCNQFSNNYNTFLKVIDKIIISDNK